MRRSTVRGWLSRSARLHERSIRLHPPEQPHRPTGVPAGVESGPRQSGAMPTTQFLFKRFEMLDPELDEPVGGGELLVEGDRIREVSTRPIKAPDATVIDCGGRTLMPGLIDSHVHVVLSEVNLRQLEHVPLTLMTARA